MKAIGILLSRSQTKQWLRQDFARAWPLINLFNFYPFSHVPSQPTTPKFHSSLECFYPPFCFQRHGMSVCDRFFFGSPVSLRLFNTCIKVVREDFVSSNSWLCTKKFQTLYFKIGGPIFLCSINSFDKFWLLIPYIPGTILKTGEKIQLWI